MSQHFLLSAKSKTISELEVGLNEKNGCLKP